MQHLQPNTILQGGKYRIERVLGQGGFGNTYVGYNTEFEETVAIKEFFMKGVTERDEVTSAVSVSNADNVAQFEEQREKFKKEARRLRKLKNDHIVKVHDLFEENGTAYYVMDFIDGESLAERIKRTGKALAEIEVVSVFRQVLEALKEVHQNEIWHLDLKPGNIMLDRNGAAYLIDFGASKQIRANGSMTTSTALCYTPGYAPNEQIGQMYDRFGPWTDLYAFGATLYNLLTNRKPPMAIDIEEDEEDAFEFPSSVSDNTRSLIMWMMQPKRKKRPQNVDEVLGKLDDRLYAETSSAQSLETEDEETILIGSASIVKENKTGIKDIGITPTSVDMLTQNTIKVGDFVYEDGSCSSEQNGKRFVGVLLSYYGNTHGQILSPVKPSENISINGKKLEWHEANISEWVDIIQNLGYCKVSFVSWDYKYYSDDVRDRLKKYNITAPRYVTRKSVNGISYIVSLDNGTIIPLEDNEQNLGLPRIYISEF